MKIFISSIRKIVVFLIIFCFCNITYIDCIYAQNNEIKLYINNRIINLNKPLISINGATYISAKDYEKIFGFGYYIENNNVILKLKYNNDNFSVQNMDKSTEKFDLYINKTKLGIGYYYNSELYFPLRSTASINSCNVDWNSMDNSINLDYNWLDLYHKVKINAVCFTSFVNNNYFCIVYDDIDKPEKSMLIFKSTAHSTFGDLTDNYEHYDRFDVLIKGLFNEFENIGNLTINIDFNKITDKKLISLTDKEYSELNALIDNVDECYL